MSLLKITTTPLEYEIKTERARLRVKEKDYDEIKLQQAEIARKQRLAQQYNSNPDTVKQVEQSVKNTTDYQSVARQRTAGRVKSTSAAAFSEGSSVRSLTSEITEGLSASTENIDFVSSFSFENGNRFDDAQYAQDAQYVEKVNVSGKLKSENQWTVSKKKLEYVPGRFHMEIIQYPRVDIEYLGDEPEKNK